MRTDGQTDGRQRERQAGRQTDRHDEAASRFFLHFSNMPKKKKLTGNRLRSENLDSNFCTRLIEKGLCMSSV